MNVDAAKNTQEEDLYCVMGDPNTGEDVSRKVTVGTNAPDTIEGTAGDDVIHGLGGSDTIRGNGGNDMICGGDKNDTIYGAEANDHVQGGYHDNLLYSEGGNDAIAAGSATGNFVLATRGKDKLYGGKGNDSLRPSYDSVEMCDGDGEDPYYLEPIRMICSMVMEVKTGAWKTLISMKSMRQLKTLLMSCRPR